MKKRKVSISCVLQMLPVGKDSLTTETSENVTKSEDTQSFCNISQLAFFKF